MSPPTLLSLPQELLDMIIEATFEDTVVDIGPKRLSTTLSARPTAAERNAGLLLTSKRLHEDSRALYYKRSTFQGKSPVVLESFLQTLKANEVEERKIITKLRCKFFPYGLACERIAMVFKSIRKSNRQMALKDEVQTAIDRLSRDLSKFDYGVDLQALKGCAEYRGYVVTDVAANGIEA